eukprot:TRINITY_DN1978_c0_g1_i1.p3 TRINITY_DN1978_c0_g1~~TRINITY_DN1978_c0_g1_i1.p3  ORF type:complete len:175 (-),score=25.64 TRINITY_DN1978_c0_g1_i1:286-768(-)
MQAINMQMVSQSACSQVFPKHRSLRCTPCPKLSVTNKRLSEFLVVKAAVAEEEGIQQQASEIKDELLEKFSVYKDKALDAWNDTENKPLVVLLGVGALVALWSVNSILNSIESVPFLGNLMELIGLGATGWYAYKYFGSDDERVKIKEEIDTIKIRVLGK